MSKYTHSIFHCGYSESIIEKIILLSGLLTDRDINIDITNLRLKEKLFEELQDDEEVLLPAHNSFKKC